MKRNLKKGQIAPNFEATVWDGSKIRLEDFRGQKVWLSFFRYASCPLCNLRIREIIQAHTELIQFHLQVIAVFQSPVESMAEYVGKQRPPFPLIADPNEKLYELYGLDSSWSGFFNPGNIPLFKEALKAGFTPGRMEGTLSRIPGDFLIDETGKIFTAFYGSKIGDHIEMEKVSQFLH